MLSVLLKTPARTIRLAEVNRLPLISYRQCAAVIIQSGRIKDPPQRGSILLSVDVELYSIRTLNRKKRYVNCMNQFLFIYLFVCLFVCHCYIVVVVAIIIISTL